MKMVATLHAKLNKAGNAKVAMQQLQTHVKRFVVTASTSANSNVMMAISSREMDAHLFAV